MAERDAGEQPNPLTEEAELRGLLGSDAGRARRHGG